MSNPFITRDTQLVVRSWNSLSGLILLVAGRVRDGTGRIRSFQFTHTPASDRAGLEQTDVLIEGTLLDLSVTPQTGTPRRGQCYVTLGLALIQQPTTTYYLELAKGYVTTNGGLIWPGGLYLDSVEGAGFVSLLVGTDPAAGADNLQTVPTGARWRLTSVNTVLTTNATVATRRVHLIIDNGVNWILDAPSTVTQAASLSYLYYFANYGTNLGLILTSVYNTIPAPLTLRAGSRIRTLTDALVAGDDFAAMDYAIEEWIEA